MYSYTTPTLHQDYLTLHVYSKAGREGRRVYYPNDALHRGHYTNNPHCLQKIDVGPAGEHR
jgi:hypothetical protein